MWERDEDAVRQAAARAGCSLRRAFGLPDGQPGYEIACDTVEQKIALLDEAAALDAEEPGLRRLAELVAATVPGLGPTMQDGDRARLAVALQQFVQLAVRFVGERAEFFSSPEHVLAVGVGDCDDSARVLVAMLLALGQRARHRLLRGKKGAHVAAQVGIGGAWFWLETTVRARAGEHPADAARRLGVAGRPDLG